MALAKTKISSPLEIRVGQTRAEITHQYRDSGSQAANAWNDLLKNGRRIVDIGFATVDSLYSTSDPTWNGAVDSFTTASYVDSSKLRAINANPIKAGDLIAIMGRYLYTIAGATHGTFRFVVQDGANTVVLPSSYRDIGTAATAQTEVLSGLVQIQNDMAPGACFMRMQGKQVAGTTVQLLTTSGFVWAVLR